MVFVVSNCFQIRIKLVLESFSCFCDRVRGDCDFSVFLVVAEHGVRRFTSGIHIMCQKRNAKSNTLV